MSQRDNYKKSEFVIGLAMLVATFIVIFGILWLGKSNIFVKGIHLSVVVNNANGLSVGDEVFYSGVKVGTVTGTEIKPDGVVIHAKIEKIKKIPKDSKFYVSDYSMIGGKVLAIEPGTSNEYLQTGAIVKGSVAPGLSNATSQLTSLTPKLEKLLDNLDKLTDEKTNKDLHEVLANLNSTIKELRVIINGDLKSSVKGVNDLVNQNSEEFSKLLVSLNQNSKELSEFLAKSGKTTEKLDSLLDNINSGKGTLGQLNKNDELYKNLNRSVISLDSLLNDIKNHPKKYLEIKVL